MKNNKGQITVESLIAVTVFIMLASCLHALLAFVGVSDYATQSIYEEIKEVSQYNYCYETIGVLSVEDIPFVKNKIPSELDFWFDDKMSPMKDAQKLVFLKNLITTRVKTLEDHDKISDVEVETFQLNEEILETVVRYKQKLPLGLSVVQKVEMTTRLWFLGDEKDLIDMQKLSDVFTKKKKNLKTV